MHQTSFCFYFFINSLLWFVVWETEARVMPLSPTSVPFSLGKLNSPGVCGRGCVKTSQGPVMALALRN